MSLLPLHETTFVVVDLETTGASPNVGAGITEIGAIKVRGGQVLGEFSTFVDPGMPVPAFITELTGITDAMLFGAPLIFEALPQLIEFCGPETESVIVAHNAPFDLGFLKAAADSIQFPWPNYLVMDTVKLARLVIERDEVSNYKLGTLAQFFETEVAPTHRALDDVKTTVEVMHRCFERLAGFSVSTYPELLEFFKKSPSKKPRYYA